MNERRQAWISLGLESIIPFTPIIIYQYFQWNRLKRFTTLWEVCVRTPTYHPYGLMGKHAWLLRPLNMSRQRLEPSDHLGRECTNLRCTALRLVQHGAEYNNLLTLREQRNDHVLNSASHRLTSPQTTPSILSITVKPSPHRVAQTDS